MKKGPPGRLGSIRAVVLSTASSYSKRYARAERRRMRDSEAEAQEPQAEGAETESAGSPDRLLDRLPEGLFE